MTKPCLDGELRARIPRTKTDIHFRRDGPVVPVVNVKVRGGTIWDEALPLDFGTIHEPEAERPVRTDAGFTHQWIREHLSDADLDSAFWDACSAGLEALGMRAQELFGPTVTVCTTGRSGGWAYVDGVKAEHVAAWNAVMFAKWRSFCTTAMGCVSDVGYQMASSIYANHYEPWLADAMADEARKEATYPAWT